MSINISYVNNRDNLVNVNFSLTSENPPLDLGNDLSTIDIQNLWDSHGYDEYTDLLLSIRFNSSVQYDAIPYINFNVKDSLITANVTKLETGEYQYKFLLQVFLRFTEEGAFLTTKSINDTNINISDISSIEISCGLIEQKASILQNTFNTIGVYEATETSIKELLNGTNRFQSRSVTYQISETEKDVNTEQFNLTEYIIRFFKSFIKLDFDLENQNIILNGYVLNVKMNERSDLIIIYETDSINIEGFYKNSLDLDSLITIFIPLYNYYKLDSKYINHNIKFRYVCDIPNNNCLIEIKIDNNTVDVLNCPIGYEIPLITANVESSKIANTFLFDSSNIIISIEYYEKTANAHFITDKKDYIKNFNGFIKADELYLNDIEKIMTAEEHKEILSLLSNGIFYTHN
jgi:hypothetical protein